MDKSHLGVYVIVYSSILSVIIPLSLAIIQWKKISHDIAPLRWLLVASLFFDFLMTALSRVFSLTNLAVGDVYMFIQFTIVLYIFSFHFERKIIFKLIYAVAVGLYVISLLFLGDYAASTANFDVLASLVFISVSIVFFYKLLNELKVVNIHRLPILWFSFGILFYYSGNLFVFLALNILDNESAMVSWALHNILNITKNIFFAVALWQSYRRIKASTHG